MNRENFNFNEEELNNLILEDFLTLNDINK